MQRNFSFSLVDAVWLLDTLELATLTVEGTVVQSFLMALGNNLEALFARRPIVVGLVILGHGYCRSASEKLGLFPIGKSATFFSHSDINAA